MKRTAPVETLAAGGLPLAAPAQRLAELERLLRKRLAEEEARLPRPAGEPTLFAHSLRVARLARRLACSTPAASPEEAYLAGLLHDAGKLARFRERCSELPEEVRSAEVAGVLLQATDFEEEIVERVCDAIRLLYREEVEPPLTTRLIDDADNLDKLGLPGVAVFFVKQGLRGIGLGERLLTQVGVELTYARCAERAAWTEAGRRLAAERARESERFFRAFVRSVGADGLHRFRIRTIPHDGLDLVVVRKERCDCGGTVACSAETVAGTKCTRIVVRQGCRRCEWELVTEMCRPRLRATG